ncbi:MAG TPA: LysR family transcriptional regulator [Rubricoccaceae bacterium]
MADDLDGITVFAAIAEAGGFTAAGRRLGVSGSAVSQTLRRLEERLGVTLFQRTTRSVHLTEAGERLYTEARPALDALRSAVAGVGELGSEPRGTLRLHVSPAAEGVLAGPILAAFLPAHPHVLLDLVVSDEPLDIVAGGYDAGIQLGETIELDMVAVPVGGDIRLVVVGAPSYFARRPRPEHPRDLSEHVCLNWRPMAGAQPYRWEFSEDGREFDVAVPARVLSTDSAVNVRLARAGVGLTMVYEDQVREDVSSGALEAVLEAFSTPFPGYYLYYPQRRHASPALRAFIEYIRRARRS